ncbi:hypothetical protein GPJ56_007226 [Histomonas meleagridis]|nr:hypothetical protein GPJ56_007226 [Histomonas meleagridis]
MNPVSERRVETQVAWRTEAGALRCGGARQVVEPRAGEVAGGGGPGSVARPSGVSTRQQWRTQAGGDPGGGEHPGGGGGGQAGGDPGGEHPGRWRTQVVRNPGRVEITQWRSQVVGHPGVG